MLCIRQSLFVKGNSSQSTDPITHVMSCYGPQNIVYFMMPLKYYCEQVVMSLT